MPVRGFLPMSRSAIGTELRAEAAAQRGFRGDRTATLTSLPPSAASELEFTAAAVHSTQVNSSDLKTDSSP
jgi:hypothetical protein